MFKIFIYIPILILEVMGILWLTCSILYCANEADIEK